MTSFGLTRKLFKGAIYQEVGDISQAPQQSGTLTKSTEFLFTDNSRSKDKPDSKIFQSN